MKPEGTAVHTNAVLVSFIGAVKVVVIYILTLIFEGFRPDPIVQEAFGTIFLTLVVWFLRGDTLLQNKIDYVAKPKKEVDPYVS